MAAALAACCLLLHARNQKDKPLNGSENLRLATLEYEKLGSATNSLLRIVACALVCGVLEVFLLYMMASYHVREALHFDVQYFAQVLTTAAGVVYSGFLVAIFYPLYAEQKAFKQRLLQAVSSPEKEGADATTSEKTSSLPDTDDNSNVPFLKSALKILSPVLMAFVTMLATFLKGWFENLP